MRIYSEKRLILLYFFLCVSRQKLTQQYSQQVSAALQQWEVEAQRSEEHEEKFNVGSLFFPFNDGAADVIMYSIPSVLMVLPSCRVCSSSS